MDNKHPGKGPRKGLKPPQKSAPRARARNLTIKQRKFLAATLEGKSSSQAARDAGYSESSSRHADRILERPTVKAAIEDILEAAGIGDELLAQRMRQGLDATVVHQATRYSRREVLVDFSERREMTELVLRVKGLLVEKHQVQMVKTLEEILEESSNHVQ